MPTSLVSTGVQFPDSTIQTTAASASGIVLLESVTVSAATTATLTSFSTTYRNYLVFCMNLVNNGFLTSYVVARFDFGSGYTGINTAASMYTSGSSVSAIGGGTPLILNGYAGVPNTADYGSTTVMHLVGRGEGNIGIHWSNSTTNSGSSFTTTKGTASAISATSITGLRFELGNGATFNCTLKLFGYKN